MSSLRVESEGYDWAALSAEQPARRHHLLAARFEYEVRQGGFTQLIYNMRGNLLADIEDMLIAASAPLAQEYYVRAIQICLVDKDGYRRFLASNFIEPSDIKNRLHGISVEYISRGIPFASEARPFLLGDNDYE
jgi:hypothetical protein